MATLEEVCSATSHFAGYTDSSDAEGLSSLNWRAFLFKFSRNLLKKIEASFPVIPSVTKGRCVRRYEYLFMLCHGYSWKMVSWNLPKHQVWRRSPSYPYPKATSFLCDSQNHPRDICYQTVSLSYLLLLCQQRSTSTVSTRTWIRLTFFATSISNARGWASARPSGCASIRDRLIAVSKPICECLDCQPFYKIFPHWWLCQTSKTSYNCYKDLNFLLLANLQFRAVNCCVIRSSMEGWFKLTAQTK